EFLIEHGKKLPCGDVCQRVGWGRRRGTRFAGLPPGRIDPGAGGRAIGHPVEPVFQRALTADRGGLADADKERGLEGVLHVLRVKEDAPADAEDQWAVPSHQSLERGLVAFSNEALQELVV